MPYYDWFQQRYGFEAACFLVAAVVAIISAAVLGRRWVGRAGALSNQQFISLWLMIGIAVTFAAAGVKSTAKALTPRIDVHRLTGR